MAIVKVDEKWKGASAIRYLIRNKGPDDSVHGELSPTDADAAVQAFATVRDSQNVKGGIEALEVVQSWNHEESKKLSAEHLNKMGQTLAERYFKGYQYLVVTHTTEEHHHNHILVNTVHPEGGKRLTQDQKHWWKLKDINDQIALENGLSVVGGEAKARREKTPEHEKERQRYRGNSYVYAMKESAQFARTYAQNFDEYAGYLRELGVSVRIKDKALTYYYQDKKKGKRADKLGREFTKERLENDFRSNHEFFSQRPELVSRIRAEVAQRIGGAGASVGASGGVFSIGRGVEDGVHPDFKAYTQSQRADGDRSRPGDHKLRNSVIPIEALRHANGVSLLDYCEHNKIGLTTNKDGKRALKGRELVEISDDGWNNGKNKTKGGTIEFVSYHKNASYVEAMADLTGVSSLRELEQVHGRGVPKYHSFYVPRRREARYHVAIERFAQFLTKFNADPEAARPLYQGGGVEVRRNGAVRLFARDDYRNAVEYQEMPDKTWEKTRRGKITKPYHSSKGKGDRLLVFAEPLEFVRRFGKDALSSRDRKDGVLALLEPDHAVVAEHLKANPHIKKVEIVQSGPGKPSQGELDLFGNLQSKVEGLRVQVKLSEFERALKERGRGPEL